jgi:hypothetical protein
MSFNWVDFLSLAKELRDSKDQSYFEARMRSAVSRAYYAAFQIAYEFGLNHYPDFEDEVTNSNKHEFTAFWFENHNPLIGQELRYLRNWRNQCDYDDKTDNLDILVENGIKYSIKIIDKFKNQNEIFEFYVK